MVDILNTLNAGSGVDIKTLAKNLTDTVRVPQQLAIDNRKLSSSAKISSVGKIMSVVEQFSSAATAIGNPQTFQRNPSSSDPTKITMEFTGGSTASTFSGKVAVNQLASETSILFPPLTSLSANLAGTDANRTLKLISGTAGSPGSELATIDLKTVNTLPALRDRINQIAGFEATIITGGTTSSPSYYIGVKGKAGESNRFFASVTTDVNGTASNASGTGLVANGAEVIRQGTDAVISVDGVQITSGTNIFNDVLPNVTITAKAVTNADVTLSSTYNTVGLSNAMATLVSGYNLMLETIKTETAFNIDPKKRGGLANNASTNGLVSELRRFTTQSIAGFNDGVHTLASLGVRTNRDGSLKLDETAFATALKQTPEIVEAVLASKQQITDSRLSIISATGVPTGKYNISKDDTGQWKINDSLATLSTGKLTGKAGTSSEGLIISLPPGVEIAAPAGYSTALYYSKGILERFNDMLKSLKDSQSSIQLVSTNATKAISDISLEQTKFDAKMKLIEDRYLKQFSQMNSAVSAGNNTRSALTTFIDSWTAGLKA
jgi:flagellar hook-associated protein 2